MFSRRKLRQPCGDQKCSAGISNWEKPHQKPPPHLLTYLLPIYGYLMPCYLPFCLYYIVQTIYYVTRLLVNKYLRYVVPSFYHQLCGSSIVPVRYLSKILFRALSTILNGS